MTTNNPVELWIEFRDYDYENLYGNHRLMHHSRECPSHPCTIATMGIIRESECSGPYAVRADGSYTVIGDVCRKCLPTTGDDISDGYHTFGELYEHRSVLFIALMNAYPGRAWFSDQHEDGSMFPNFFIAGMDLPSGQVTYHMREKWLELVKHSGARELPTAPPYDGHNSADVVERLTEWVRYG